VLDLLCALSLSKRELCPSTGSGHHMTAIASA
jgi:hypothetical protein